MRKVAVFFGGKSCENEISVLTGVMVLNLIDKSKYEVYPVYVHTDGAFYTSAEMFDVEIFRKVQVKNFQQILTVLLSDCTQYYDTMGIEKNKGIIEDVLYSGIWAVLERKIKNGSV